MKKGLPLYMLESDHSKLKKLAKSEGVTMNALVNKWIKDKVRKVEL